MQAAHASAGGTMPAAAALRSLEAGYHDALRCGAIIRLKSRCIVRPACKHHAGNRCATFLLEVYSASAARHRRARLRCDVCTCWLAIERGIITEHLHELKVHAGRAGKPSCSHGMLFHLRFMVKKLHLVSILVWCSAEQQVRTQHFLLEAGRLLWPFCGHEAARILSL